MKFQLHTYLSVRLYLNFKTSAMFLYINLFYVIVVHFNISLNFNDIYNIKYLSILKIQ